MLIFSKENAQPGFEKDIFKADGQDLTITFIGHGTLMFEWKGLIIHIDPVSREADYTSLPDADLILVCHQHGDHLDESAIANILKQETRLIMTEICYSSLKKIPKEGIQIMKNGDSLKEKGILITAIPAYNVLHKRDNGQAFHPKGEGNGYVLDFGGFKVLVAGDTENIPEIKALKDIDVAFLPMNLPYTMTPEMVADAATAFKPKILYPYHYGNTETSVLIELMKNCTETEVRIRKMN